MQTSTDTDDAAMYNPERLMSSPRYGSGICSLLGMPACKANKSQMFEPKTDSASESGQKAKSSGLGGMSMPKGNKSKWSRCCEACRGYSE
jgi:hypothetical protein